jgi:hypothetical protein
VSTTQAPTARDSSARDEVVDGTSLRAEVEPDVGSNRVIGSRVRTAPSPAAARSTQGCRPSHPRAGTRSRSSSQERPGRRSWARPNAVPTDPRRSRSSTRRWAAAGSRSARRNATQAGVADASQATVAAAATGSMVSARARAGCAGRRR